MGCIFHDTCRKFQTEWISHRAGHSGAFDCRNVSGGKIFLQKFLPDGSRILTGSSVTDICTSQRPGILHSKVQCMFQKMSGEYRTSDGWFLESRRRLFPVPEMYRYMSEEEYSLRSEKDQR